MRRLELGSSKLPWGRASLHESGTSSEWDEYIHDLHQLRLKHVRADVKQHMKTPRSLIIHQRMNQSQSAGALKKSSQQEERYQEIERANRALLNRLSSVMRKPGDITGMVNATANQTTHATLNEGFRKKELKRIDNDNDKLIQMIERGESSYSRKKMSKDRKQQEKYLKNLSRYRNGPQPTALRTTPKMKKPSKKRGRGRLRAKSQKSINNQSNEDFTGYADWRRQKHQRKKKWSQSLPPLENDGGSMLQSQSSPGISFESNMHVGHTTITETTLNGPRGGGRQYQQNNQNQNQNNHRHNQSPNNNNNNNNSPSPNKNKKERVKIDIGQAAVPNHTKVFEAGRQMNGVFAVVSAITRGPSLIIQAFVPEDQTTTEVEVTPAQAKYAMRNISADIFRPERREDLCRALVAKVEFFFKDSKRMLLFNKTSQNGDSALAPSIKKDELLFQTPPEEDKNQQKSKNKKNSPKSTKSSPKSSSSKSSSPKPTASSPNSTSKRRSDQEEELDEEEEAQMNALEGVFQLIQGYVSGSTILKSKWIESINSSDRVKSVLRSEILCGYPALRFLRVTDNYQNELHQLQTKINGEVTVNELLLFAQDLSEKIPNQNSGHQSSWKAACRMFNRSQRKVGRHVMFTLHNWSHLRITDLFTDFSVWECQLASVVSDSVRRATSVTERVEILKEYVMEEDIMMNSNSSYSL